jgi:hypothetical protein
MNKLKRAAALRRLLELCDDLDRLRTRMEDPALRREARARLRRSSRRKAVMLTKDLAGYRFRGPLGQTLREHRLDATHFRLLAVLLNRHLRTEEPAIEGRLLLGSIFETSFEILSGIDLLHESSPLRTSGLVVLDDEEDPRPGDLLEARFRLSDEAILWFRAEVTGQAAAAITRRNQEGYASNREYLVDLKLLQNLYRLRSERVFHPDRWGRVHREVTEPGRWLSQRIRRLGTLIRQRLERSLAAAQFPAVKFKTENGLSDEELVIVVHLLFREIYEGIPHADSVELLRLISTDEADLLRNRRLLLPDGRLRSLEIVSVEPFLNNRELTGEVHLNDWVVNELLGATPGERAIDMDERLNWHLYLKQLEDTERFYRDLGQN